MTEPPASTKPPAPTLRQRLTVLGFGLLVGFVLVEIALRVATVDAGHGRVRIAFVGLVPYPPPESEPEPFAPAKGYLTYDEHAGWSPRPLGASADGMYLADQHGLRASAAAPREIPADKTRILLVGDSFAHSDEVRCEESLGAAIEKALPQSVVLNAGVPGFGTDQAYLRYLALRDELKPSVVILGVHQNDFERNVRLFSSGGEWGGTLPFSKPRFLIDEKDGDLSLVNSPPVRGDAIRRLFDDYDVTEFARWDSLHVAGETQPRVTDFVRTFRFLRSFLAHREYRRRYAERDKIGSGCEIHRVTGAIVERFARDVKAAGSVPVVITLPARWQITSWRERNPWWDAPLRAACEKSGCAYVDVTPLMSDDLAARGKTELEPFTQNGMGHYKPLTNAQVAAWLIPALSAALDEVRRGK